MSIQFQCAACAQPIEIESEWAGKPVACPYCRKTVTAPEQSTLDIATAEPPVAAPLRQPEGPDSGAFSGAPALEAVKPSRLGWWALLLAIGALLVFIGGMAVFTIWSLDFVTPDMSTTELQQAMGRQIETHGMSGFVALGSLLMILAFASWAAGLVCGIMALRQPTQRRLAVGALATSAVLAGFTCLNILAGLLV